MCALNTCTLRNIYIAYPLRLDFLFEIVSPERRMFGITEGGNDKTNAFQQSVFKELIRPTCDF